MHVARGWTSDNTHPDDHHFAAQASCTKVFSAHRPALYTDELLSAAPLPEPRPNMVAPTISVTHHGATQSKMIISPPRINLRRAASYNASDRGPLSSSSSRFGFEHLVFNSPPPSPGLPLPQQASRMRKSSSHAPRPSRVIRCLLWLSGAVLITYLASKSLRQQVVGQIVPEVLTGWASRYADAKEYEMVGQDDLPDFPTPIVVTDRRGRAKWTVSIPTDYDFPLTTKEYGEMCAKCREVATRVQGMHSHSPVALDQITLMKGDSGDRYFMDVGEAEKQRFLPGPLGSSPNRDKHLLGMDINTAEGKPMCASSLTYVLESDDAGLGKTLMNMWMAYGLAKREGRAFFIEDSRWAYGDYTSMFEPPPAPDCRPPPRHEMIPCPRQARHLIISAVNAQDILGGHIDPDDIYLEGPAANLDRRPAQRQLFQLARTGYEVLFKLNSMDREYVFNRVIEHKMRTYAVEGLDHNGRIIGVHVRHGDRHPLEFQYADSYIPLSQYVDAAHEMLNASLGYNNDNAVARSKSFLVLASDDPLVYDAEEFQNEAAGKMVRAQELIRLAGKGEVNSEDEKNKKPKPKNVMHKFTDETFGWEGGFFAAMFWNLGLSSQTAATPPSSPSPNAAASHGTSSSSDDNNKKKREQHPGGEDSLRLRSLVGRAYAMDLAVLADMTSEPGSGVVCAVSSTGCRLLAVMMGYERAFRRGEWRNVDGEFGWNGFAW